MGKRHSKDKKAKFKKYSVKEMQKDRQDYHDQITRQVVTCAAKLRAFTLNANDLDETLKMKQDQLDHGVQEKLNGMCKTVGKIRSEYMMLHNEFNNTVYEINKLRDELLSIKDGDKDMFTKDDINDMISGKFKYAQWEKDRNVKQTKE